MDAKKRRPYAPRSRRRKTEQIVRSSGGVATPAIGSDDDVYWTFADVVRKTRLSRRTIYRLVDAGQLRRHYPRPRCPRFIPVEVAAMRERVAELQFGSA